MPHGDLPSWEKHNRLADIQELRGNDPSLDDFAFDANADRVGHRRLNHRIDVVKGIGAIKIEDAGYSYLSIDGDLRLVVSNRGDFLRGIKRVLLS